MSEWIRDKLVPAMILAALAAAVSTYVEVRMLRVEMDRLNVYVDQLWRQK